VKNGINIIGAGAQNTRLINAQSAPQGLEEPIFDIQLTEDMPVRVSGIYFQDTANDDSDGIRVNPSTVHPTKVRVDNCTFEGFSFAMKILGAFGVCDNCYFLNNRIAARISGYHSSTQLRGLPPPPWPWDSTNYFVWEDCSFELTNWNRDVYMMDTEYPANYMVRYCKFTINRSAAVTVDGFDMHGNSASSLDGLGIVIYKNTFTYTGNNTVNPCRLVDIRGGVGSLVYSNTVAGVKIYASMRDDPNASPLMSKTYVWNNTGDGSPMSIGRANGVTEGTNFITSPPPDLAELEYPHPLRKQ
jgi:hypothetical protein